MQSHIIRYIDSADQHTQTHVCARPETRRFCYKRLIHVCAHALKRTYGTARIPGLILPTCVSRFNKTAITRLRLDNSRGNLVFDVVSLVLGSFLPEDINS